jgi:Ser/Thr protein kinase RdoA (MazF antagonist)
MAPDASHISTGTVRAALSAFGIGRVRRISRLHGGAGRARKFVVDFDAMNDPTNSDLPTTDTSIGRALLKCTPRDAASLDRLTATHAVQRRLAERGLPIAMPMTETRGGTVLADQARVYELIPFIDGERWQASPPRAAGAGRLLAAIHNATRDIDRSVMDRLRPPRGLIAGDHRRLDADGAHPVDDGSEAGYLWGTLADCVERVEAAGIETGDAAAGLVHGDFHPGNMRWRGDDVAGLFDFDACRRGHAIEEAALASVHFSIDRGSKAMDARAPWPDSALLDAFWSGYAGVRTISDRQARAAPWIAAGAFSLEVLGGVEAGSFSPDTVSFAAGVIAWLVDHAEGLGEVIAQSGPEPG